MKKINQRSELQNESSISRNQWERNNIVWKAKTKKSNRIWKERKKPRQTAEKEDKIMYAYNCDQHRHNTHHCIIFFFFSCEHMCDCFHSLFDRMDFQFFFFFFFLVWKMVWFLSGSRYTLITYNLLLILHPSVHMYSILLHTELKTKFSVSLINGEIRFRLFWLSTYDEWMWMCVCVLISPVHLTRYHNSIGYPSLSRTIYSNYKQTEFIWVYTVLTQYLANKIEYNLAENKEKNQTLLSIVIEILFFLSFFHCFFFLVPFNLPICTYVRIKLKMASAKACS